ncbi:hypothetical protein A4S06_01645 [Erysipelotrichaceae bacterium MTC7]|nr:hypothetical protein A4S06_01645 [Erysipelotrichaceae bacterium MTC7]
MKKFLCLLCAMCMVGVVACGKEEKTPNVCGVDCEKADVSEYEAFKDENHVFLEVNMNEANDFLESKEFTGVIYYGFPTCPWCIEVLPVLNDVAKTYDMNVYYVDRENDENKAHPEWREKATKILDDAFGLEKKDGEPNLFVPEVVFVKNGKIVGHHMGTNDDHDATERKMNDKEIKDLTSVYESLFEKIK